MQVVYGDYFGEYQLCLAWRPPENDTWCYYPGLSSTNPGEVNTCHPVVGYPEMGGDLLAFLRDFAEGPQDIVDLGRIRLSKSKEPDPQKFNQRPQPPVVQAVALQVEGQLAGVAARVVVFARKEPQVLLSDDAEGKFLILLYGGIPRYLGSDFRYFLPLMQQSMVPGMRLLDMTDILRQSIDDVGVCDELLRDFQSRAHSQDLSSCPCM